MKNENNSVLNVLSGNQLKVLALIAMTCDHVGKQILPQYLILQIVGRLAFPIFAYMIAEGCRYTGNRKRYLLSMAALAFGCQVVYGVAMGSLYQCVLVTFSLSIILIYAYDYAVKTRTVKGGMLAALAAIGVYFISVSLPKLMPYTDFAIDYGLWGILLPVFIYIANTKTGKLAMTGIGLLFLSFSIGGIQWYSLVVVVILFFYSGKRGTMNMKNLFYIYYPLHLVVIYVISLFC